MNNERRGFIGGLIASVTGIVSFVFLGERSEAHKPPFAVPPRKWPKDKNEHRGPKTEFIKTIGIGGNVVTCYDQDTLDAWEDVRRQTEAARIMRTHGLQPARYGQGPQWLVHNSLTGVVRELNGRWVQHHWAATNDDGKLLFWDDPVQALIEAEPLYLKHKPVNA